MIPSFSQPIYLALLFALPPAVLFSSIRCKKVITLLSNYTGLYKKAVQATRARIIVRTICWSLAWICISVALAGPSWGTQLVPAQKAGRAVSFVFDISYSMTAKDIQGNAGVTRLESSQEFSRKLLSVFPGVATSAVLAKGDGILAVPLTEDYYAISNLINALSPTMLSAPGSSLSKGVRKAIESFPPQSARSSYIIVLSDGDDTDENLFAAVEEAVSFGIHVIFVGFGSQNESTIIAGDGVTEVKTALRVDKLQAIVNEDNVEFILASDSSALEKIVSIVKPSIFFDEEATTTSYEVSTIERHSTFVLLAIIFFLLGVFVYVINPQKLINMFVKSSKIVVYIVMFPFLLLFTGCNEWVIDAKEVLEGSYYWSQQEYQESVASFLEVSSRAQETQNLEVQQYGLFGLSASYIMQGEMTASLTKLNEMQPVVSPSLDFARWYNKGVIFHRRGEYKTAAFCFKKALLIDGTNINAKINLEVCLDEGSVQTQQGIQERIPVSEQTAPNGAADAVFSVIRESEENQWKTQEPSSEESDIIDY